MTTAVFIFLLNYSFLSSFTSLARDAVAAARTAAHSLFCLPPDVCHCSMIYSREAFLEIGDTSVSKRSKLVSPLAKDTSPSPRHHFPSTPLQVHLTTNAN